MQAPTERSQLAAGVLRALTGKPEVSATSIADDGHWRGRNDARALRVCFSDAGLHAQLASLAGADAWLFDRCEQARAEAKIPQFWSGVRANVAALRKVALAEIRGEGERELIMAVQ